MKFEKSKINTVKRLPKRGFYDADVIYPILDTNFIAHISFLNDGIPMSIPTAYGRLENRIYIHGAVANNMLKSLLNQEKVSITITALQALVLAKSAFHHSMNYTSVVIFGRPVEITDDMEKRSALEIISEHILRGRWKDSHVIFFILPVVLTISFSRGRDLLSMRQVQPRSSNIHACKHVLSRCNCFHFLLFLFRDRQIVRS